MWLSLPLPGVFKLGAPFLKRCGSFVQMQAARIPSICNQGLNASLCLTMESYSQQYRSFFAAANVAHLISHFNLIFNYFYSTFQVQKPFKFYLLQTIYLSATLYDVTSIASMWTKSQGQRKLILKLVWINLSLSYSFTSICYTLNIPCVIWLHSEFPQYTTTLFGFSDRWYPNIPIHKTF